MTISDATWAQIRRHGLTADDKTRIAAEHEGCSLCGRAQPGKKGWVVDHDRACCPGDASCLECRRGILCQWCNNALGYAFDSPTVLRRMADYIELGTRLHPSHVWSADRLPDRSTDRSTDQVTESLPRVTIGSPTNETNETNEEFTTATLKSDSELRAGTHTNSDGCQPQERRRFAPASNPQGVAR